MFTPGSLPMSHVTLGEVTNLHPQRRAWKSPTSRPVLRLSEDTAPGVLAGADPSGHVHDTLTTSTRTHAVHSGPSTGVMTTRDTHKDPIAAKKSSSSPCVPLPGPWGQGLSSSSPRGSLTREGL